jgi:hypothetical protein
MNNRNSLTLILSDEKEQITVKAMFFLCMPRTYTGGGGAPLIFNLSTRQHREVSFKSWPLYLLGKNPWVPTE